MLIRSAWFRALIGLPAMVIISFAPSGCVILERTLSVAEVVPALLHDQAGAWNDGDIERFMQGYWKSPELTFSSGGKVTRGWQSTFDNYQRRYPTRDDMGHLTFADLEIISLGTESALVLGRWKLERTEPIGGNFTLVLRRERGRWVIIHDHTSRDGS